MLTAEIKRRFVDHFSKHGHSVVPSAPLPAISDPNLLFVNAGMVPFVPFFLGHRTPPYTRATSVQKCIRTPDIDEVGKTSRHGTFFQMNGNFSFGDYFKSTAITLAWELSTGPVAEGGLGLDPDRIWATVYREDDEAAEIWRRTVGLPAERIVRRGKRDNFWSMTVPGPCGPSSELYYDRGPAYGPDGGPDVDEDRFLEFWNLVFMQYERGSGTDKENYPILGELPAKNIDTGMGLERMASLLQGVDNLYEIDEVRPILDRAAVMTGRVYGGSGAQPASRSHPDDVRLRVVADHVRTALMVISDGVVPANEGRGYVLRRILRRAVRSVRLLGWEGPAMPELLPVARDCMAPSYPELVTEYPRISAIACGEEETFLRTLRAGSTILDLAIGETKSTGGAVLGGAQAFQLHDTYGFPIDLTLEIAAEQGLDVDREGFRRLMAEQRDRAKRDAQARKTGHADLTAYRTMLDTYGPTDWLAYQTLDTDSQVLALLGPGGDVPAAVTGEIVDVLLDRTPFYAESGGQAADAGQLVGTDLTAEVIDVQRPVRGLVVHKVRITSGTIVAGRRVCAAVDPEWRQGARQAHSGTHVVHAALRQVLGPQALQSGSANRPGHLRLDYSWRGALSPETRSEIEEIANLALRADLPVEVRHMSLTAAREAGALALFGETYDETVRVVDIGGPWSRELCGGTHVSSSAQIGAIAVTTETSVGSGQRRIEARTGIEAFRYLARERDLVARLAEQLRAPREELPDRLTAILERLRAAERRADQLRQRVLRSTADELVRASRPVDGVRRVVAEATDDTDPRQFAELIVERMADRPGVAAVVAPGGKGSRVVVATTTPAVARGMSAVTLIRKLPGGRGGGSETLAQGSMAGAPPAEALAAVTALLPG
ncbi:alanine--tRNA ligase [Micromonospora echinospora]